MDVKEALNELIEACKTLDHDAWCHIKTGYKDKCNL